MKERRNGLRPVTAKVYGKTVSGYFHCFSHEGNLEEGVGLYANIELEDGKVVQVDAYTVKFEDVEPESK